MPKKTKVRATKKPKATERLGPMVGFRVEVAKAQQAKEMAEASGLTLTQVLRFMLDEYVAGRFRVELSGGPAIPIGGEETPFE